MVRTVGSIDGNAIVLRYRRFQCVIRRAVMDVSPTVPAVPGGFGGCRLQILPPRAAFKGERAVFNPDPARFARRFAWQLPIAIGQLHKVWVSFIQMHQPTEELWAFEADWRPEHEMPRNFRGYAFARDGSVVRYLVIRIRQIDHA
jgi:hypothetical protein